MEPGSTVSTKAARGVLLAVFAVSVYRAATQSITPPEAATYIRYVGSSWQDALSLMTANNHVLYTLLARISTTIFHLTDLSLRLPGLVGAGLYLWAVYRLVRRTFGTGPLFLAAVALLVLNPLVMDYLCMARGYGLALAFWIWSLELMLEEYSSLSGVCLGLCVASNLSFLAPAVALAFVPVSGMFAILTAFLVLVIPMNHTDFHSFNYGATSLRQTLQSLTTLSLGADIPLRVGVGAIAIGVMVAAAMVIRRRGQGRLDALVVILASTTLVSFIGMEAAHRFFRIPFPLGRSALYFIPVITLAAIAMVRYSRWKIIERAALVVAALLVVAYLSQFSVQSYREWPAYANGRSVVKAIRRDAGPRPVRAGASAGFAPVLNYYRARYALGHWAPVPTDVRSGSFDYYVLNKDDETLIAERHLTVIFRDGNWTVAR